MTKRLKEGQKQRVVIDSNVWLSGLVFGGYPSKILELFINGDLFVVMSEELVSELRRKIVQKFPLLAPKLGLLEASIWKDAIMVKLGTTTIKISRDPNDDKFIETALLGGCRYIISGDQDLLALGSYQDIHIVKPTEFLKIEPLKN